MIPQNNLSFRTLLLLGACLASTWLFPLAHATETPSSPPSSMIQSYSDKLIAEAIRLYPDYAANPLDTQWNKGSGVLLVIEGDGTIRGHIFGADKDLQHKCYQVATRKVLQVWRTGYHTGRFEELVFAGKLNEGDFGVAKPDFIGWEGGVPLLTPDGKLIAAAFSGFQGVHDVEIIERAAKAIGLTVKRD